MLHTGAEAFVPGAPIDPLVYIAVLCAAALHAGWNAAVKSGLDRVSALLLLSLVQAAIALPLLAVVPEPARAAWPWIAGAAVLHAGYKLFLGRAYRDADLGQVYPLARGSAPLIVALVSAVALGEVLGPAQLAAVLAISAGVLTMALRGEGALGRLDRASLGYALGTACFTAGYTLVDAGGARIAGTASGFLMWMVLGDTALTLAAALLLRGPAALRGLRPELGRGLAAGAMSLGSYWIAVWAFTQAPVALVAALRESSILFALLIGTFVLGERAGRWRWIAGGTIATGVLLMRL